PAPGTDTAPASVPASALTPTQASVPPSMSAQTPTPPAAPAAPAKAPAPSAPVATAKAAPSSAASLTVSRMLFAGSIQDRQPVHVSTTFPASKDKVYCYLELADVAKDQKITYVWTYGGKKDEQAGQIKKAARWRTWSYKMITGKKGEWKVDVLDEAGVVLKSATFGVE
ncbi:MAG: DUF2914 domain-containing protein, partial [Nitrospirota bacterium]|nr:DUF2914 domain-containing protein [Nitrospirota bacterium]